ncbi:hypothetical protein DUNSADRAFT_15437 [Dunaliella salina]|uniref:Uncharacterized protein n=1 Tax=Dunaliella salina TaxID=3046 RepID=A0ABQ7G5E2_DUNSA|nr:hypothetical protein DUNSADRAFT_15437 [Dunaliella salina]|eukprot:KAF5829837.1 hypothetical protein DUNSADRAFT_15437 [Dunaliella salina]
MSRTFSLEDEEQHVENLLADPVLQEGKEKAMNYDKAANNVKAKYGKSIQQHNLEKEQLEFATLEHDRGLQSASAKVLRKCASEVGGTERDQTIPPNQVAPISSDPPTYQVPRSNPEAASEPNAAWKIKEALQE